MRLVIDILDWQYKSICKGIEASKRCGVVGPDPVIHEAIYKGTPLPKGHGDLIDVNDLRCERADFDTYNDYCTMFDEIDSAPTIIEADGEAK